ncbi:MAG: hypothetical protein D3M94_02385 [Rhodocyclales bacterium GT-UBC]|nr:MAG: hypothetical protein D3M94_02385 [Rhodocyclales bacterium GT-UBC]
MLGFAVCLSPLLLGGYLISEGEGRGGEGGESLSQEVLRQREELAILRARVGGGHSLDEMERSAKSELLIKVRNLERENAALKEDLLLFERLAPLSGEETGVRIDSFRVWREAGSYRYRWVVGYRPSGAVLEFHGRVQVVVFVEGGEGVLLPEKKAGEHRIDVRGVVRREGEFVAPHGGEVKLVELRVLQNDEVKVARTVRL